LQKIKQIAGLVAVCIDISARCKKKYVIYIYFTAGSLGVFGRLIVQKRLDKRMWTNLSFPRQG
jgi:hypothetical protein